MIAKACCAITRNSMRKTIEYRGESAVRGPYMYPGAKVCEIVLNYGGITRKSCAFSRVITPGTVGTPGKARRFGDL